MSENVLTVPHKNGTSCLAFRVLVRKGDWCIGQTAHCGVAAEGPGFLIEPHLRGKQLAWLGEDEWFGRSLGDTPYADAEMYEALDNLQRFDAAGLIAAMKGRPGWIAGEPKLSDLRVREMPDRGSEVGRGFDGGVRE